MTNDEARAVILAASRADGGCGPCACQVLESAVASLPDVDWEGVLGTDEYIFEFSREMWLGAIADGRAWRARADAMADTEASG